MRLHTTTDGRRTADEVDTMSFRKVEATVPKEFRQHVLDALTNAGGIGHETHVGESIVVTEGENATIVGVTCSSQRAGELMNVLTKHGVGVAFGTVTSLTVASQRPNPTALVQEFKELKAKIEERANTEEQTNRQFQRKWRRRKERLDERKIEYVQATTGKSVEELFNEIVDQGNDNASFYTSVACASIIAGLGLLTNSAVVVLSAMLISPLMGPILSAAFGASLKDPVLFWGSLLAELRAALVTFLMGAIVALVYGPYAVSYGANPIPTAEMAGRGEPSGLLGGFIIALASGIVVANAITSDGVNSLVGVAISASLLPPIVNSGIMVMFGIGVATACEKDTDMCTATKKEFLWKALYSFLLYALNVLVIIITAGMIFYNQKVGRFRGFLQKENKELLDAANSHVRAKLQIATGIRGALDDETFDKLLFDAKPSANGSAVEKKDLENGRMDDAFSEHHPKDAASAEFSILRPFPEPTGVTRAKFAGDIKMSNLGANIGVWVRQVNHLLQR